MVTIQTFLEEIFNSSGFGSERTILNIFSTSSSYVYSTIEEHSTLLTGFNSSTVIFFLVSPLSKITLESKGEKSTFALAFWSISSSLFNTSVLTLQLTLPSEPFYLVNRISTES